MSLKDCLCAPEPEMPFQVRRVELAQVDFGPMYRRRMDVVEIEKLICEVVKGAAEKGKDNLESDLGLAARILAAQGDIFKFVKIDESALQGDEAYIGRALVGSLAQYYERNYLDGQAA